MSEDILILLQQAVLDGIIECSECGNKMEPDAKECWECGWKNELILNGMI